MFKVMDRAYRGVWHEEHFSTEAEAREYANKCFKTGSAEIELYAKDREGYRLVKAIKVGKKQAIENFAQFVAEDAPCFV